MQPSNSSPKELEIAAILGELMVLFWQPDETPEVRKIIARGWTKRLVEFDAPVVAQACDEWLRRESRRPAFADIYKLCREGQDNANWKRARALPPPKSEFPPWWNAELQKLWPGGPEERQAAIRKNEERRREDDRYWAEQSAAIALRPVAVAVPAAKKPPPVHVALRDAKREEERQKVLMTDDIDGLVDRYMAATHAAVGARKAEIAHPEDLAESAPPHLDDAA